MSQNEFKLMMDSHRQWLETAGRQGSQLELDDVNLTQKEYGDIIFEQAYITSCQFNGICLNNEDFYATEMYSCNFSNALFIGCSFRKATIDYCKFDKVSFIKCLFPRTDIYKTSFVGCHFEDCSFVGINLMQAVMRRSVFMDVDWDSAYIDQTRLIDVTGKGARNLQSVVQPKIAVDAVSDDWLQGDEAIDWLFTRIGA